MTATADAKARVMALDHRDAITDRPLMRKSLLVIALVIVGFVSARFLGLEAGTIALFGAALLLLLVNVGRSAEDQHHHLIESFNEVEWITIFFFVGLFIVVAGVEHAGLLKILADWLIGISGGDMHDLGLAMLWVSAILSAIIDNIPFVATMIPVIQNMAPTFGGRAGAAAAVVGAVAGRVPGRQRHADRRLRQPDRRRHRRARRRAVPVPGVRQGRVPADADLDRHQPRLPGMAVPVM